jgi:hypothetical protein
MSPLRLFQVTLALVLWYFLAGLTFSRVLGVWPPGYEAEGFFLTGAALPWSLLALGFYGPTESALGAVVRDCVFLALIAGGIAVNAVIVQGLLRGLIRELRLALRLRRLRRQREAAQPPTTRAMRVSSGARSSQRDPIRRSPPTRRR